MPQRDDIFENWSAGRVADRLQASLDEQNALRQAGDSVRLKLDAILAKMWGVEFDQTGELEHAPIEDQVHYATAAE